MKLESPFTEVSGRLPCQKGVAPTKNEYPSQIVDLNGQASETENKLGIVVQSLESKTISMEQCVNQIRAMRGGVLSENDVKLAYSILDGSKPLQTVGKGSFYWLTDEILTILRLQSNSTQHLAIDFARLAFSQQTDPGVRDYIMQHIGHLWEQSDQSTVIEADLWEGMNYISDDTTAGSCLIALNRGYERDKNTHGLEIIGVAATQLAQNDKLSLQIRITALTIAGERDQLNAYALSRSLSLDEQTPFILRKVAESIIDKFH